MKFIPEYKSDFHQFLNWFTVLQMIPFLFLMVTVTFMIEPIFGLNHSEQFILFMINLMIAVAIGKYLEKYGEKINE